MTLKFTIWKLTFDGDKMSHVAAAFGLLALLAFDISAMSSTTMIEAEGDLSDFHLYIGAFRTDCVGTSCSPGSRDHDVICSEQDKSWIALGRGGSSSNTDCSKALSSKCDATQFFLLFGFFCHLISIVVPFVPKVITLVPAVPHLVGFCTLLCSAFSYFVVWCIWAALKTNKLKPKESDCGLTDLFATSDKLGGAFFCTVLAWLACCVQFGVYALGRNDGVNPTYGVEGNTKTSGQANPASSGSPPATPAKSLVPSGESSKV
eukprot:m.111911 g.111911  ORF g.111911 m.111911 type:complete len:262 (+) comp21389_c0_seq1:118-903(+)